MKVTMSPLLLIKENIFGGVPNYLPLFPVREDSETMNAHVKVLRDQAMMSSDKRNKNIISRLIDKTFADRKGMIASSLSIISNYERNFCSCSILRNEIDNIKQCIRVYNTALPTSPHLLQ